jgi:uncharacterized protein YecE (DUF72 family)
VDEKQKVLFGTSGWSYEDWRGVFYPEKKPKGFNDLEYAAAYFDALEINSTFYRPAYPNMAKSWARRTEGRKGFEFTAKLHQRFTHSREERWTKAEADEFKRGIAPLAEAGKLGGLLVQFPWSFKNTAEERGWLEALVEEFREFPLFLEVRHDSWRQEEFFKYLDDAGVGFVDIDQPVIGKSIPPMEKVTGGSGYVRMHGRNAKEWFKEDAGRDARYDYLYNEDELKEWVARIRKLAATAEKVFVFNNNHYRGQAAVNSLELKNLLTGEPVAVPGPLAEAYPRLQRIAVRGTGEESQGRLV